MKDKSKKLLVINTNKKPSSTQSSGGTPYRGGFGGVAIDMSDYLLKAVWDRVFELKTDKSGAEYLFSKLPLATQYGITMYADGGELNLPDIYEGIPFDNKSIWYNPETKQVEVLGGNGSSGEGGVSNFWDLNGIPGWITNTKPTYNYSEIKNTPDLSEYVSSDDLKKYVSLDGNETINGLKNFTKGLQIDGLPLTKLQDDVVYLDANLVVRGGITMFGTGEDVDVPTIMDALSVDGVNLQVINGVLTFVGEATGGVADSVRWENVIGRPTLLSSFTDDVVAGKYLPLNTSTTNILTSSQPGVLNFKSTSTSEVGLRLYFGEINGGGLWYNGVQGMYLYNAASATQLGLLNDGTPYYHDLNGNKRHLWHSGNFNPANYLPLSGGTINGSLTISDGNKWLPITIDRVGVGKSTVVVDNLGLYLTHTVNNTSSAQLVIHQNNGLKFNDNQVLDASNYSSYALPYTGGRLSNSATGLFINRTTANTYPHITFESQGKAVGDIGVSFDGTKPVWYNYKTNTWSDIITSDNAANYNVGSATKLKTARTIWGQSFDGTGNVSGDIDLLSVKIGRYKTQSSANNIGILSWKGKDGGYLGYIGFYTDHFIFCNHKGGVENSGISVYDDGKLEFFSTNGEKPLIILSNGNVGIGTDSPTQKLHVEGQGYFNSSSISSLINLNSSGNIVMMDVSINGARKASLGYNSESVFIINRTSNHYLGVLDSGGCIFNNGTSNVAAINSSGNGTFVGGLTVPTEESAFNTVGIKFASTNKARIGCNNSGTLCIYASESIVLRGNSGVSASVTGLIVNSTGDLLVQTTSAAGVTINRSTVGAGSFVTYNSENQTVKSWRAGAANTSGFSWMYTTDSWGSSITKASLDSSGNFLVYGGITMYSDQRKKTILNHVELSLKQIADAPLIEHYYNSDESKTTHVGSIAQYWAEMNDWFCKEDNEGFYTMEIQNAALASAISIARELHRYESKTDKKIRLLQKRIGELEEEIEKLKTA